MTGMLAVSPEKDIPTVETPAAVVKEAAVTEFAQAEIGQAPWTAAWAETGVLPDPVDPRARVVVPQPGDTSGGQHSGQQSGEQSGDDPGGVFQLLRAMVLGHKGPVVELVQDRERFQRFFPPPREGPTIAGEKYLRRPDDVVVDGATLAFPKGVFWLRNLMHYRRWFPSDITIRGAGMEETLLYMDPVRSQGLVRNLRIENCTLFVAGSILHLGNGPATLRCQQVRFVGFDTDSGLVHPRRPTPALVTAAAALHFIECRFEGGYGDQPSHGALMNNWSAALVARFDRCHFSRLHLHVPGGRATVVFDDCVLADLCDDPRWQATHSEGIRFRNCRFENHWLPRQRRQLLYLEVLFPGWRDRLVE